MSVPFLIAGILSGLAFVLHGVWAEYAQLKRLRETDLPASEKLAIRGAWHIVSLTFLWSSITLFVLAFSNFIEQPNTVGRFISLLFIGYALFWALAVAIDRPVYLIKLPLWVLMLAVGALAWWGTL